MNVNNLLLLSVVICIIYSCEQEDAVPPTETFKQTWYAGKAELSTYNLQQARYGEIRNGEAVLIFVTEDFSTNKIF